MYVYIYIYMYYTIYYNFIKSYNIILYIDYIDFNMPLFKHVVPGFQIFSAPASTLAR